MKALSGYAEWFWLIAKNLKDVENRNWPLTRYVKQSQLPIRIYLHASKKSAGEEEKNFIQSLLTNKNLAEFNGVDWKLYRGCLIGEALITGQSHYDDIFRTPTLSPWFFGPYGFWIKEGILFDKPIPYKGQLGFFEVKI